MKAEFVIKIGDLGFSKVMIEDELFSYCGTPLNMAPEILRLESYALKADIWSLGVALFELITGTKPFLATTLDELIQNVSKGTYFLPKHTKMSLLCIEYMNLCLQYNVRDRETI
jgi:serine/threonine protein kinase